MVTKNQKNWATRNGYTYIYGERPETDVIMYKTNEGYSFSMCEETNQGAAYGAAYAGGLIGTLLLSSALQQYVVKLAIDHDTWSKEIGKAVNKELKKELKGIAVPSYIKGTFTVTMKKGAHTDKTYEAMCEAANITSKFLYRNGVRMPSECIHCKTEHCDTVDLTKKTGTILYTAHSRCVNEKNKEKLQIMDAREENGGYIKGLLALIPGIIVASIPALVVFYLGFYFWPVQLLMFLLVPIIALSFYKGAKGKGNIFIFLVIVILSLAAIAALVVVGEGIWFLTSYSNRTLDDFINRCLLNETFMNRLTIQIAVYCAAGFIGCIIAYINLKSSNKKQIQREEEMRAAFKTAEQSQFYQGMY
ncbi:hypothetical protein LJC58_04130 [Lachnospiraceae bacterium OttesenSCG-928-D06]|nr:hypothetical protein [Lachnospiraceae bacterium OttesenSCG-928-D06]